MTSFLKKVPVLLAMAALTLLPLSAEAVDSPKSLLEGIGEVKARIVDFGYGGSGLSTATDPAVVLTKIINQLLAIVAVLALLALVVGGIMYIVAFGEEKKIERAKKIIIGAIIGLLVVGLSFAIISTIQTFLA